MLTRQAAARFCEKWRHVRHPEIMTRNWKSDSVNLRVFTWRKFLPNVCIPFQRETTELSDFFEEVTPTTRRTRWVVGVVEAVKHYVQNQTSKQSNKSDLLKFLHNQIHICSDTSEKNLTLRTDFFISHGHDACNRSRHWSGQYDVIHYTLSTRKKFLQDEKSRISG